MASSQTTKLLTALQSSGIQTSNPALYQVLRGLLQSVDSVSNDIITIQSVLNPGGVGDLPVDVTGFIATLLSDEIVFSWDSQGPSISYEIRYGSTWSTASYITTTLSNNAIINPLLVGTYTYLIKAINSSGNYSPDATSVTFSVTPIGSLSVAFQLVSNNILFSWNEPSSVFSIDHYNIYRNSILIGTSPSTFFVYFETTGGTNTYTIQAVDIAGNTNIAVGPTLTIPSPSDYVLQATLTDIGFTGIPKVNCFAELF